MATVITTTIALREGLGVHVGACASLPLGRSHYGFNWGHRRRKQVDAACCSAFANRDCR